jgi:hypothetical protein
LGGPMIQQRVGDLLEIEFEARWYYVVVLTKVVMFGGNIVFAYHSDGGRSMLPNLDPARGFNVCTDLLLPKRTGAVARIHRFPDVASFWRTKYTKSCFAHMKGEKAKAWFIHRIDDLSGDEIERVQNLTPEYRAAMDSGCFSFDLTAEMILAGYTPEQNEHI